MQPHKVPSLSRFVMNSQNLRFELARAISSIESATRRGSVLPPAVAKFNTMITFLTASMTALNLYTKSVAATPNPVVAGAPASTQQLVVTQTRMDNTTAVVTGTASYVSSDVTKATVSAAGLVTRVATGSAVITVGFGGKFTTVPVTIS